ncbi:unnamed protein product [Heterobilharzia americana]|nr:unnamed protein product [Heterobilharzia americana]
MEALRLSETEVHFYFSTFDSCDVEKSGKLSTECVKTFLSRSGLSHTLIDDIVELSDPSACGFWGRVSFFTALKLVSLAQCGFPVSKIELIRNIENLPLPVFSDSCNNLPDGGDTIIEYGSSVSITGEKCPGLNKQQDEYICHDGEFRDTQESENRDFVSETLMGPRPFTWPKCYEEEQGLLTEEFTKRDDTYVPFKNEIRSLRNPSWHANYSAERTKKTTKLHDANIWGYQDLPDFRPSDTTKKNKHRVDSTRHSSQSSDFHQSVHEDDNQFSRNTLQRNEISKWKLSHSRSSSFPLSQYNGNYFDHSEKRRQRQRKSLSSFALQSKREAEYALQFDELFIFKDTVTSTTTALSHHLMVAHSEVTQLFTAQYKISSADFDHIWFIADVNRDNYLNKQEFCLASHLAYLFGHRGLTLEDAIIACKPYINKLKKRLTKPELEGNRPNYQDDENLCTTGLLTNNQKYNSTNNYALKPYSTLEIRDWGDLSVSEYFSHPRIVDSDCAVSETDSANSFYNSFEDLSHGPTKVCSSSIKSSSSATTDISASSSSSSSPSSSTSRSSTSESGSSRFDQNTADSLHLSSEKTSTHNPYIDPVRLLSAITGRRISLLSELSSSHRRRLLSSLIREAKSVNHTLLRLNNEMQCELAELNDQRVNLSAQLQHLGLQPTL